MLVIRNFIKKYGHQLVLDIPALEIDSGIYWVKGANGSGKTSFFKSVAGIIPCKGYAAIDDTELHKAPTEYRRMINYAEAEPLFPEFLSGQELIDFYAVSKRGDKNKAADLVNYFEIENFVGNPVGTYSSGMMKKLSVLLAFIGQPRVILLDEPLITIESGFLPKIYELVNQLYKQQHITFLISSHQPLDKNMAGEYKILSVDNQTIQCNR